MSEIKPAQAVWGPPEFPAEGRLELSRQQLEDNYKLRKKEENKFKSESNIKQQVNDGMPCCKTLHMSFFFDGTNNHRDSDIKTNNLTNVARLFEATYDDESQKEKKQREYFKYYMPGVGAPFPEIREFDFSGSGLAFASGGENRINWALLMLVNSLWLSSGKDKIDDETLRKSIDSMASMWPIDGIHRRRKEIKKLLQEKEIAEELHSKPQTLAIKLYVYGFSRGAAEARAFVHWVAQLFDTPENLTIPSQKILNIPVSVEFLGVFDTVASVGIAHIAPAFSGHFDWANETQQLPSAATYPSFIRCCRHFIAAHEQRLSFPLDSIRQPKAKEGVGKGQGSYSPQAKEVVYPGMHSDVGGGYAVKDQGKAIRAELRLSNIALHDMYAAAFQAGAPLCALVADSPKTLAGKPMVYPMLSETARLFNINPEVITRFNAWRKITLKRDNSGQAPIKYEPEQLGLPIEKVVEIQMAWMTAWRIDRYAKGNYYRQNFYKEANNMSRAEQDITKENNKKQQKEKTQLQKMAIDEGQEGAGAPAYDKNGNIITYTDEQGVSHQADFSYPNLAGPRPYEADVAKTQLEQAATEFKHDYEGKIREHTGLLDFPIDTLFKYPMYLLNSDDERVDYERMKKSGDDIYLEGKGFPAKAEGDLALVRDLFDDQIHDSRAWFMHDQLNTREPWNGYFRYRMTYMGNETNKSLSMIAFAGQLIGIATLAGGIYYTAKQRNLKGILGGVAGTMGVLSLEYQVVDMASGLALPFMDNALEQLTPSTNQGALIATTQTQAIFNSTQGVIDGLSEVIQVGKILQVA